MVTLFFQSLDSLLLLVLGALVLRVGWTHGATGTSRRTAWLLAGICFTVLGVSATGQSTWAVQAFFAGPGTQVYDGYLRWAPAWNYSRCLMVVGFGLILTWVAGGQSISSRRAWGVVGLLLGLWMGAGALLGYAEGPLISARHFMGVAVIDLIELVVLCTALLVALRRNTLDWPLWLALCIYLLQEVFNVLWISAAGWGSGLDAWMPPLRYHAMLICVIKLAMIAVVALGGRRLPRQAAVSPGAGAAPLAFPYLLTHTGPKAPQAVDSTEVRTAK